MRKIFFNIAILIILIINLLIIPTTVVNASCVSDPMIVPDDMSFFDWNEDRVNHAVFIGTVIDNTKNVIDFKVDEIMRGNLADVVSVHALAESEMIREKKETESVFGLEYGRSSDYECGCKRDYFEIGKQYKIYGASTKGVEPANEVQIMGCSIDKLSRQRNFLVIGLILLIMVIYLVFLIIKKRKENKLLFQNFIISAGVYVTILSVMFFMKMESLIVPYLTLFFVVGVHRFIPFYPSFTFWVWYIISLFFFIAIFSGIVLVIRLILQKVMQVLKKIFFRN